ncbi:MAG: hypothetical protein HPY52_17035 [Firmicutes bacterium]|nr:hypothetical protein [Bacillota bacterium]
MIKIRFHGAVIMCKSCGNGLFEEVIDDHCQIFRCLKCRETIAFGNAALVERIKLPADLARDDTSMR